LIPGKNALRLDACAVIRAFAAIVLILSLDVPAARVNYHKAILAVKTLKESLPNRTADGLFSQLDQNMDKSLDEVEMTKMVSNKSLLAVDKDGNGQIDIQEFHNWASQLECSSKKGDQEKGTFCSRFCDDVFSASIARQHALNHIRDLYPIGSVLSSLFDFERGMDQEEKIKNLFAKKSCKRILQSVDRTNFFADLLCFSWAVFAVSAVAYCLKMRAHKERGLNDSKQE